jgi:uncharacterized protein YbbC (DUF1343 family)
MTYIGLDQIHAEIAGKLKGKRVGLITNNMARNSNLISSLDIIRSVKDLKEITVLSPEHGYFGDFQAGSTVNSYFDNDLNVKVESLYREPETLPENLKRDIDHSMRTIDSQKDISKYPSKELMEKFDIILYDLQDVGCRIYTYIATMIYTMEMLQPGEQEFVVLDRPNPITGKNPEGPILQPDLFSFIGAISIPMRHSLTIGEIGSYYNKYVNKNKAELNVVKVKNWKRNYWHDQTGYPWIMPSPNMPALETAIVYPGTVMIEGTNISEGRGTTRPFQIIGAPWVNGTKLKERINRMKLPGVQVMEIKFRPSFSKYSGDVCYGIYVHVKDRDLFRPFGFALDLIGNILDLYPENFVFHDSYFDKASGNKKVREMLLSGNTGAEILEEFDDETKKYLSDIEEIKLYGQ